ncbi:hypothetical protein B0T26DRAFT_702743 [Lasiosphaeria miniovina]|uniref:CRIB domain-containing protein n=1 Tax=Lasiosphaeria miniovina TaxID=1954250 RepID=A0AA40AUZ5_9PEZI|nr:uncharacterized protein B0T26DRAFT_702743 [Lasiosphaeria miniovina]KAK0722454.1 hypothetical protein B0T26DRAFT_702743 [Lasiosphaeria miniovina]
MNIWAVSNTPVHSVERRPWRRSEKKPKFFGTEPAAAVQPVALESEPDMARHDEAIARLLQPAMDGPPSPESIRALNKQVMRAPSSGDRHHSQTSSSGSSSLRSLTSADRPSWDTPAESLPLSRKSSGRSTASSMQPRERPESVQIFGKTLFSRRSKHRAESNPQSSSETSLNSADLSRDLPPLPTSLSVRDSVIPSFFSRRRAATHSESAQRKLVISEPYNFQHMAHSQKDRAGRSALSSARPQDPLHFADFSSEELPLPEEIPAPRRVLKHTRSHEQLNKPPPRPPRSPIQQSFGAAPPTPPPRVSSRMSLRRDSLASSLDQSTTTPFRHPQPYAPALSPPAQSYTPALDMDAIPEDAAPKSDDLNWPLPADAPLPDVPEEDETGMSRPSRASVVSNRSLRASQSVPVLKALSLRHDDGSRRRSSGASDTLGRLDLFTAQRALKVGLNDSNPSQISHDSWEDDIDYCYEHAAEADCDYAWERPSLDLNRDCDCDTLAGTPLPDGTRRVSPATLSPGCFDVPDLSPVSQLSATAHEAITPILPNPRASNFSLPIVKLARTSSEGSFRESHGFTLSPSLLIPADYREASDATYDYHDTSYLSRASASDLSRPSSQTGMQSSETLHRFPSSESSWQVPMPTLAESDDEIAHLPLASSSDSNLVRLALSKHSTHRSKESIIARRQRSRTSSLSNQYALFPSLYMGGNRI